MGSTHLLSHQLCVLTVQFLLALEISLSSSSDDKKVSVRRFSLKLTISLAGVFRFSLVRGFEIFDPKEDFLSWVLDDYWY